MERFAVIDIGTNSIRLRVVQPESAGSFAVVCQQKEGVRLGAGEFEASVLTEEAMERALVVCRQFAEAARAYGAKEIVAVATAAAREASNRQVFLRRARREAGIQVRVISGQEEARLIYLGAVSGLQLAGERLLVIDIGGGSTELAAGSSPEPTLLESMKLGAIRLASQFTEGVSGPVSARLLRRIQEHVQAVGIHSLERARDFNAERFYGGSGTILNLVEIAARRRGEPAGSRARTARRRELREVRDLLAALPLEQRRRVAGINPDRADIIVPGAALLVTVMEQLGAREIQTTDRALPEGVAVDHLVRSSDTGAEALALHSTRARSVLRLVRRCHADEQHAWAVARLAVCLFDEFAAIGLLPAGPRDRELLQYAAFLHDVGGFVSYTDHHRHGYYLVRHSPLLGFDVSEIDILAALVMHHRKSLPKRKTEATRELSPADFRTVEQLSVCLRLAEAIERGHVASVREVSCSRTAEGIRLELHADGDCHLALWALEGQRSAFASVFGAPLFVEVVAGERAASVREKAARAVG
jgi:exopolyphosphatase/guanosine-5'-triphosphate,3'-diphosphate pyrophosphatase